MGSKSEWTEGREDPAHPSFGEKNQTIDFKGTLTGKIRARGQQGEKRFGQVIRGSSLGGGGLSGGKGTHNAQNRRKAIINQEEEEVKRSHKKGNQRKTKERRKREDAAMST